MHYFFPRVRISLYTIFFVNISFVGLFVHCMSMRCVRCNGFCTAYGNALHAAGLLVHCVRRARFCAAAAWCPASSMMAWRGFVRADGKDGRGTSMMTWRGSRILFTMRDIRARPGRDGFVLFHA